VEELARDLGITLPASRGDGLIGEGEEEPDAIVIKVLACLAPNLAELSLQVSDEWSFEQFLESSKNQRVLSSLKCLKINHYDTEGGFLLSYASGLIAAAPNLEVLRLFMCQEAAPNLSLHNLRCLEFHCSYLMAEDVQNILATCTKLEVFRYSSGGGTDMIDHMDQLVPPKVVVDALRRSCRTSLRKLELTAEDNWRIECMYSEGVLEPASHVMGSLRDFTALEELLVDLDSIYLATDAESTTRGRLFVGMLPKSICKLVIDGLHAHLLDDLMQLSAATAAGRFPKLRRVELHGFPGARPHYLSHLPAGQWAVDDAGRDRVREALEVVGVHCEFPPRGSWDSFWY
jgi:hypothetical protein